jgi:hypothetical protein
MHEKKGPLFEKWLQAVAKTKDKQRIMARQAALKRYRKIA